MLHVSAGLGNSQHVVLAAMRQAHVAAASRMSRVDSELKVGSKAATDAVEHWE